MVTQATNQEFVKVKYDPYYTWGGDDSGMYRYELISVDDIKKATEVAGKHGNVEHAFEVQTGLMSILIVDYDKALRYDKDGNLLRVVQ